MPEDMSISVNGNTQVPPGFRFHPTEEELLNYYLKKKVSYEKIDLDVIRDVDLNKLEPWDIQEKCKIGTTPQNDWYFFSHKDKKYPTGTRTNRATTVGFWKATGRDKTILGQGKRIGMRKTLVFYRGRAPHGQKSDWIMHEYRLDDNAGDVHVCNVLGDQSTQEEGWVVCRIFKKKSHHKTLEIPLISSSSIVTELDNAETTQILDEEYPYYSEGAGLGQMLEYMGNSTCKEEAEPNNISPIPNNNNNNNNHHPLDSSLTNWSTFDRLVASHLNGQTEAYSRQLVANLFGTDPSNIGYYNPDHHHHSDPSINIQSLRTSISLPSDSYNGEAQQEYYHQLANDEINHIWSFDASTSTRSSSSSDPLHHVSNYSALQNGYLASPTTQRI